MAERLEFEAGFKDKASPGVKKLGKVLADLKPSHGMVQTQKWFSDFRHGADQTVKAIRPVSGMLNSVGVGGLAASLSIGEMVKQFKELADSTLTLKELGRETGLTIDQIRQLQYAAGKLHVDPAAMNGAISSWSSKMVDFRRHVGDFYKYLQFNKNGDIAAKIIGENPEQGFKDTLDYLSRIPAAAMKAGKSAADAVQIQKLVAEQAGLGDLVPMLGKGPDGLAGAFADASREVKPLTQEMINAADKLNSSIVGMNQSWNNFKNSVGPSVIVPITEMIDKLNGAFQEGERIFNRSTPETAPPRKPDGTAGESGTDYLARTFRNSLRATFQNNGLAEDGQALWDNLFGVSKAHAEEVPASASAKQAYHDAQKPFHPDDDRLSRARAGDFSRVRNTDGNALHKHDDELSPVTAQELFQKVREGSKEGIVAGLREMAQEQALGGRAVPGIGPGDGGGGRPGGGAGMSNMRYGRGANGAFRHGPGAQDPNGAFNPQVPTTPGTYRPQYKLSDSDLDDRVVNTIAGEATSSPESIDAVVNNMLNRVGSKGWGPSANLLQVARAPGQYAGYRQATPQLAERIRARIRAIASGGVPDNTNGSNAYRAAWYHGKWYRDHAADGRVVGGNRFAYESWTKNGPYAPYPASKTAADAFAAHQKALKGTPPQAHASGGPISGPGGPRSDSIFAMLSNGEFVVNARDAQRHAGLLHAINSGGLPAFADGGSARSRYMRWLGVATRGLHGTVSIADTPELDNLFDDKLGKGPHKLNDILGLGGIDGLSPITKASIQSARDGMAAWKKESDRLLKNQFHRQWNDETAGGASLSNRLYGAHHANPRYQRSYISPGYDPDQPAGHKNQWEWLAKHLPDQPLLGSKPAGIQLDPEVEEMMKKYHIQPKASVTESQVRLDIHHHENGRIRSVRGTSGKGVKLGIKTAPTMRPT